MLLSSLREAFELHRIELIACILLPNSYHLLLRTPEANLDKFMYELNKRFSQKLRRATGRINQIFSGPYKRSLIESRLLQKECFRYLAQASLRSGCAGRCENYPYVILKPNKIGEEKSPEFFQWLNEEMSDNENRVFQAKLKRSVFKEEILKSSRRKVIRKD